MFSLLTETLISFPLQQPAAIFMVVLFIILLTPLIFNRLKIPHIAGLIIAGMLVGPDGFNILANDASFEIFGQVGIIYLMFLAGIEIDMFDLRENARQGAVFGLLSFILPMIAGLLAARFLLHTSWVTAALISSMLGSHTLISYPIITRFGLSNSRPAVISICGTMVAVFLALLMLGEVGSISLKGGFDGTHILRIIAHTIIYVALVAILFPRLTRAFFRKVNESVPQYIFVMALVLTSSLTAQLIGLEPILGAFLAGIVLNRFIPSRSALMRHIEFVGNAIFIPYFLIGVGMLLNSKVIFSGWEVVYAACVMSLAGLLTKWLAAFATQKIYRLSPNDRQLIFGLSSGKAAATIAAVMLGYRYSLLSEDLMNGAVLMILICCAIASIATQRAGIKLRMQLTEEELKQENGPQRKNARQVVAVANPITAESITKLAILMRHPRNDLPLTALFVRSNDDPRITAMGRESLKKAQETAAAADTELNDIERYDLNIVAGLVNVMKEKNATDLIIGLHRRSNIVDSFYGSLIEQLLRSTNRMVTMSRCFIPVNTIGRIVVFTPQKAEYETGFRMWVERMGNLATQLSCRAIFMAYADTIPYIRGILSVEGYKIRHEFIELASIDDFIVHSNEVGDDDLLVVIGARRTSVSFSSDLEHIPTFLNRYFSRHNIMVIYPEQFGSHMEMPAPMDSLQQNIPTSPTAAWFNKFRHRSI